MNFRQAIQIGNNVYNILMLPCVISVTKEYWNEDIILRYNLFGDVISKKYSWGDSIYAYKDDWICEDYDGNWHLLTPSEYKALSEMK